MSITSAAPSVTSSASGGGLWSRARYQLHYRIKKVEKIKHSSII